MKHNPECPRCYSNRRVIQHWKRYHSDPMKFWERVFHVFRVYSLWLCNNCNATFRGRQN